MQMSMFDPREAPVATEKMLTDRGLRRAIAKMREGVDRTGWPLVAAIGEIGDARAWAVDDGGVRYVVLDNTVFRSTDLWFALPRVRKAARAAFARFDEGAV
jgi:hypothetical protein